VLGCARITFAGVGKGKHFSALDAQKLGGGLVAHLNGVAARSATVALESKILPLKSAEAAANIAYGARLRDYRFDKYFTQLKAEDRPTLAGFTVLSEQASVASKHFSTFEKVAEGVMLTRDLVSEPANIINPETLAAKCRSSPKWG